MCPANVRAVLWVSCPSLNDEAQCISAGVCCTQLMSVLAADPNCVLKAQVHALMTTHWCQKLTTLFFMTIAQDSCNNLDFFTNILLLTLGPHSEKQRSIVLLRLKA